MAAGRAVYLHFFSPYQRMRRELAGIPIQSISPELAGMVHLVGKVRALAAPLTAPLSQRPCVAYELELQVLEGRGWKRLIIRRDAVAFTLTDAQGTALVQPHANFELGLRDDLEGSNRWYSRSRPEHLGRLRTLLQSMGVEVDGWLGLERSFRFREGVLEPGESAAVQGLVVTDPAGADPRGPLVRGVPHTLLLIADLPPGLDRDQPRG